MEQAEVRFRTEPIGCSRAPDAPPTVPIPVCPSHPRPTTDCIYGERGSQRMQRTTSKTKAQVYSLAVDKVTLKLSRPSGNGLVFKYR